MKWRIKFAPCLKTVFKLTAAWFPHLNNLGNPGGGQPNRRPTAANHVFAATEDTVFSGGALLTGSSDPDGDTLTVTPVTNGATAQGGSISLNAAGVITAYTPAPDFNGVDTFFYTVTDGQFGGQGMITFNVAPVADPAYLVTPFPAQVALNEGGAGYEMGIHFPPNTTLSQSLVGPNVLPAFDFSAGNGYWGVTGADGTHQVTFSGSSVRYLSDTTSPALYLRTPSEALVIGKTYQVTINVSARVGGTLKIDHAGGSAVFGGTVGQHVFNITANSTVLTIYRNSTNVDITMDAISIGEVVQAFPAGVSVSGSTLVAASGTGDVAQGTYAIAAAREGVTRRFLFQMAVTAAAPAVTPPVVTATFSFGSVQDGVQVTAGDVVAGIPTPGYPAVGVQHLTAGIEVNGTVYALPRTVLSGQTIRAVVDYDNGTHSGRVFSSSMVVEALPNRAPVASAQVISTPEDTVFTGGDLLSGATDPDGNPLSVVAVTGAATAQGGTISWNDLGVITGYTPPANYYGPDTINFTITDGELTDSAELTINVTSVNDAPTAVPDTASTAYNTPVTVWPASNDTDPDGGVLSVQSVGTPTPSGAAVLNGNGSVTFTPSSGFVGQAVVPYVASDGQGGTANGTITVDVAAEVNVAPVAVADTASTAYETTVVVWPAANDTDANSGDTLGVTSVGTPTPSGTAVLNGNGSVSINPASGFIGEMVVPYTVGDGNGGTDSSTITVTVAAPAAAGPYPMNGAVTEISAGVSSASFTLPASLAQNDVVIVVAGSDWNTNGYSIPAGSGGITWTNLLNDTGGSPSRAVFLGVVGASPLASATINMTAVQGDPQIVIAQAYRGADMTQVQDVTGVATSGATGLPDAGSLTSATANTLSIAVAMLDDDEAAATLIAPTNYTMDRIGQTVAMTVALASRSIAAAGTAVNPAAFTDSGAADDAWGAYHILLRASGESVPTAVPDPITSGMWSATNAGTGGQINVTINSLPASNGAAITDIEWTIDGGSTWTSSGGITSFPITGLTNDVAVSIQLRAVNSVGPADTASDVKSRTPTLAASGPATVTTRSTTFNLANVIGTGKYEDGSDYVVRTAGSQLTSTSPASGTFASRTFAGGGTVPSGHAHGLVINPGEAARYFGGDMSTLAARQAVNIGTDPDHGYDSYKGKTVQPDYDPAYNVDPGKTGSALALDQDMTLVKATSKTTNVPSTAELILDRLVPLHVVGSVPAVGSFAPPIASADKSPRLNISEIKWERLLNHPAPSGGVIPPASEILELLDFTLTFEHLYGPNGENIIAPNPARMDTTGDYFKTATYMGTTWQALAHIAVALHTDAWSSAEKQAIVKKMAPFAINVAGRILEGGVINDNGGWAGGGAIVAWLHGLTDNAWLLSALNTTVVSTFLANGKYFHAGEPVFGDLRQHRAVLQSDINATLDITGNSGVSQVYQYSQAQLGWPEWGGDAMRNATTTGTGIVRNSMGPFNDHPEAYRHIKAKSDIPWCLAATLNPQMRAAIEGINIQMLYYADRYMGWWGQADIMSDGAYTDWSGVTYTVSGSVTYLVRENANAVRQWVLDLWTSYRGDYHRWTPTGVLTGEQSTAPSSITIAAPTTPVYGANLVTDQASVLLSGTHNGASGDIFQYRLVDSGTSAQVLGWQDFPANGATTWSHTIQRAPGWTKLRAEVRAKYATGVSAAQVTGWYAGDVVVAFGQSLMARPLVHTTPNPSFTPPADTLWILYNDANGISLNPDATTAQGLYTVGASSPLGLRRIAALIKGYGRAPAIIIDTTESGTGRNEYSSDANANSSWAVRMGATAAYLRNTLKTEATAIIDHWFTNDASSYTDFARQWMPMYLRLQRDGLATTGNGTGVQNYTGGAVAVVGSTYTPDHFLFDLSSVGGAGDFDPSKTKWIPMWGASHFAGSVLSDGQVAANDTQKAGVRAALDVMAESDSAFQPVTLRSIPGYTGQSGFGGHMAQPGGTHVASDDFDGESLAGLSIWTALLRATGALSGFEPRYKGHVCAANGTYVDIYYSLPDGGQLSTPYLQHQAGVYNGSLEAANWVTPSVLPETTIPELHWVQGYSYVPNGGSRTFRNFTAAVHDAANGIVRVTFNTPFTDGAELDYGKGDGYHLLSQADANASRPHIHRLIGTRTGAHISGTGYGWTVPAEVGANPLITLVRGQAVGDTNGSGGGPVNVAPVGANGTANANQDEATVFDLTSYVSDADGDPLTITGVTSADAGVSVSVLNGAARTVNFLSTNAGTVTFTYTVSDGNGGTDTGDITVTVAATPVTPSFTARSVVFDDTQRVNDQNGLSVAAGSSGLISMWLRATPGTTWNSPASQSLLQIQVGSTDSIRFYTTSSGRITVRVSNSSGTDLVAVRKAGSVSILPGEWVHLAVAWTPTGTVIYINGTQVGSMSHTSVDFAGATITGLGIGSMASNSAPFFGALGHVYINLSETLDLSVGANLAKLISAGAPVDMGANGSLVTGNQPDFYFDGPADTWVNQGTGGVVAQTGTLTAGTAPVVGA